MSQVIYECLFWSGTSRLISDHIFGVISAECMNIIEIDIISLLDNTRYFIPCIKVILPKSWIIALCSLVHGRAHT